MTKKNLASLIKFLNKRHILTVGDGEKFGAAGGMVRFFTEGTKVRFEVSLSQVERMELKVSAKLLSLAKVIR